MATPSVIDFDAVRETFFKNIKTSVGGKPDEVIKDVFEKASGSEAEKKVTLDQAFRDVLIEQMLEKEECQKYKDLITMATECVMKEWCSPSTPFLMLSDLFDCLTLEKCADIFAFVEERVETWKSDPFYSSGKTYLLRMCNDLLRRMSKSQNTLFCGRIQMFLARLFPLSEKSGLNLTSQFNLDNTTLFGTKQEDYVKLRQQSVDNDQDEKMELEEGETDDHGIPVDYNLYKKFWSLQDFFRKPVQCFEKVPWKTFANHADEVLHCFSSYKLDDMKTTQKKLEKITKAQEHTYFAKYLTSEKLLDLQLSDGNFRRYVLVQFLVLFQYLSADLKFKSTSQVLNDEQAAWAKKTTERVYELLKETPPEGAKFAKSIEHTLSREENWSSWKNLSCPSYVREKLEKTTPSSTQTFGRKRSLGDDLKASGGKLIKMGSGELTRLWNLNPDNMAACRSEQRNFVPKLENFFEMAIMQSDPEAMVENEYKLVNNQTWSWKALRLLSRHSPHFFTQSNNNVKKTLQEYMDSMLGKLKKEMPGYNVMSQDADGKTELEDEVAQEEAADDNIDRPEEAASTSPAANLSLATPDDLDKLSSALGGDWKKLATELGFDEDEIQYVEAENKDVKEQALKLLTLWAENEDDKATKPALKAALKEIGLETVGVDLFGADES